MSNNYFTYNTDLVPGTRGRSGVLDNQFLAIEAAFDLLPTDTSAINRGTPSYAGSTGGTGNAFTVTMPKTRLSNQDGDLVVFKADRSNTGAATLNVDGIGNVSMVNSDGTALVSGDIISGLTYAFRYVSGTTRFQMMMASPRLTTAAAASASAAATSASNAASSATAAASSATAAASSATSASSSATAAASSASSASSAQTAAEAAQSYAEEWANKAEDSLISAAAGGNESDEYSALHWAAKAAASATAAAGSAFKWEVQNSVATAALGSNYLANSHAGFALTMPGTFAAPTSGRDKIQVLNIDSNSDITLTPASGDEFYVLGTGLTTDATLALRPGEMAVLTPRTANTDWDVTVFKALTSGGDVAFKAGAGIDFSANTEASATGVTVTSEKLNWYEEGEWTPNIWDNSQSSSEGQVYTRQVGRYTRIGRVVLFECEVVISDLGTLTTTQSVSVGPLPVNASSVFGLNYSVSVGQASSLNLPAANALSGYIGSGGNRINVIVWDSTQGYTGLAISELSVDGTLSISGHYIV